MRLNIFGNAKIIVSSCHGLLLVSGISSCQCFFIKGNFHNKVCHKPINHDIIINFSMFDIDTIEDGDVNNSIL